MADAVAEQIAALKDEDWAIREEAAMMLGTLRDPRAVGPLVSVLRDGDRAVRDAAIGALLAIGEPAVTHWVPASPIRCSRFRSWPRRCWLALPMPECLPR
jgi:FOG: HEAT repeat